MKQRLKDGYEWDLKSRWRKRGWLTHKPGVWKSVKKRLNKRFRRDWKKENAVT